MTKRTTPPTASEDEAPALPERYRCPVPFHAVRTRILGNIASPDTQASPIRVVETLWGGELPTFDSIDARCVVVGLWNRLTRNQARAAPFRLIRLKVPATRDPYCARWADHPSDKHLQE
jgi:hypothetical protein